MNWSIFLAGMVGAWGAGSVSRFLFGYLEFRTAGRFQCSQGLVSELAAWRRLDDEHRRGSHADVIENSRLCARTWRSENNKAREMGKL